MAMWQWVLGNTVMAILAIRRDGDQWAEGAEGGEVQRGEKLDQVETCL